MEPPLLMMWRCLFLRCLVHNTEWWQGQLKSISGLTTHPPAPSQRHGKRDTFSSYLWFSLICICWNSRMPPADEEVDGMIPLKLLFFTAVTNYPQRRWWSKILVMLHYIFWTESKRSICRLMITLPLLLVQPLKDFAGEEIWNGACRDKCRWDSE